MQFIWTPKFKSSPENSRKEHQDELLFCSWGQGKGNTWLLKPETNWLCHFTDGARTNKLTFSCRSIKLCTYNACPYWGFYCIYTDHINKRNTPYFRKSFGIPSFIGMAIRASTDPYRYLDSLHFYVPYGNIFNISSSTFVDLCTSLAAASKHPIDLQLH